MAEVKLDDIVSLAKRRGFIFQGSEVYGGLAGTWDYGPLGTQLKRNIMQLWWRMFVEDRDDMVGVDAAILMNQKVWQASGHVDTFTDPLVECGNCHARLRADKLADPNTCPACGKQGTFSEPRQFNMMFETKIGPTAQEVHLRIPAEAIKQQLDLAEDGMVSIDVSRIPGIPVSTDVVYLRPETAQGIFTNYKNVVDTLYPDVPFGIAQQGKAFRNEISPRDFIFRSREFEQMEIEYFVNPDQWESAFQDWVQRVHEWCEALGLPEDKVHELEVPENDRAHYSKRTIDFEYDYPIGREELLGLAYRTDFDLQNIEKASGKSMQYRPKDGSAPFVPHVIEPSFGVERALMAVLCAAYTEDEVHGEKRVYLKLPPHLAPVKVAVSPLLKNKPELVAKANEVFALLKHECGAVLWDDNGNIGKRYRRQDEIGTPFCVTVDFETIENNSVTIRSRDTTEQQRVAIEELATELHKQGI
ncbi:MAG TPA: glycine--tRNA ligase [Candidatus Saccharimonadales bacterium]|nr:glycine--tRNA ligase [Candidatus Saccharimonadales bacterium]